MISIKPLKAIRNQLDKENLWLLLVGLTSKVRMMEKNLMNERKVRMAKALELSLKKTIIPTSITRKEILFTCAKDYLIIMSLKAARKPLIF